MVQPFHPFAAAAAALTVAGAVVELATLNHADPAMPRCGYLLLLLSLPLWIIAEVRRALKARGQQSDDSFTAGYFKGTRQFEQAAIAPRDADSSVTALDSTERHGR